MIRTQTQTDNLFDSITRPAAPPAVEHSVLPNPTLPDTLQEAEPLPGGPDSLAADLPVEATDSTAIPAHTADEYTLWYRKITSETSDEPSFPTASVHYRPAEATEVFGTQVCSVPPLLPPASPRGSLTTETGFQGLVLVLTAAYILLLSRHWPDVVLLSGSLVRPRLSSERLFEEPLGNNIGRLKSLSIILGLFFAGMVAVRLLPTQIPDALTPGSSPMLWMGATLIIMLLGWLQSALLFLSGAVTLNRPLVGRLQYLRRVYLASTVLLVAPALLFYALATPRAGFFWITLAAIESIITSILYLIGSLNLFLAKKISILYWFLYLCAVEIFPLSLLWLLVQR